jgi:predicted Zn-dependent peptidase
LGNLAPIIEFGLPDDYLATYTTSVDAVSLADVRRVAEQHVAHDKLTIVVVGDQSVIEAGLRELGLPLVTIEDDATS